MGDAQRISMLEQRIERLERRLREQCARAITTAPAIDTGSVQKIQSQIDPVSFQDGIPTLMTYGFSSSVPVGGDQVMVFVCGDRSQGVVIATGHQSYRFSGLQQGEVVMHDMWGHSLHLSAAGAMLTGNLTVNGAITASGGITAGFGTGDAVTLQGHRHGTGTAASGTVSPTAGT